MTNEPKLKPCPFCGGDDMLFISSGAESKYVFCDCGGEGPPAETGKEAACQWNTRAEPSQHSETPKAMDGKPKLPKKWEEWVTANTVGYFSFPDNADPTEHPAINVNCLEPFMAAIHAQHSAEVEGLMARIAALCKALSDAADDVEDWAQYQPYLAEKHKVAETVAEYRKLARDNP